MEGTRKAALAQGFNPRYLQSPRSSCKTSEVVWLFKRVLIFSNLFLPVFFLHAVLSGCLLVSHRSEIWVQWIIHGLSINRTPSGGASWANGLSPGRTVWGEVESGGDTVANWEVHILPRGAVGTQLLLTAMVKCMKLCTQDSCHQNARAFKGGVKSGFFM